MTDFEKALAGLKVYNGEAIATMRRDPGQRTAPDLLRDVVLEGIAESVLGLEQMGQRLERLEAMLAFFLSKQVVEGRQRPTPDQAKALGKHVTNFVTTTSLLDQFTIEWAKEQAKEKSDGTHT